jgi:hypothetical protein
MSLRMCARNWGCGSGRSLTIPIPPRSAFSLVRITDDLSSLTSTPVISNAPSSPRRKAPRGNQLASPSYNLMTGDSQIISGIGSSPRECEMNAPSGIEQYLLVRKSHTTLACNIPVRPCRDGDACNHIPLRSQIQTHTLYASLPSSIPWVTYHAGLNRLQLSSLSLITSKA